MNPSTPPGSPALPALRIERAAERDVPTILSLIRGLAEYEQLSTECTATEAALRTTLFGPKPAAEVVIGYVANEPVGFAVFVQNYSTFLAKPGLYLEDLFVKPEWRRRGFGRALLSHLAAIAVERGYGRMEWSVLDWNAPSIAFYKSLGARAMDEWTTMRVTGDALRALAGPRPKALGLSAGLGSSTGLGPARALGQGPIACFVTGGTFDKTYDELTGKLSFDETHLPEMLRLGRSRVDVSVRTLMMIDSLDMTDADRALIVKSCNDCDTSRIVITHGTDTMVETAAAIAREVRGKTVVLTGAMIPYAFGSSDGLFNLGSALSFVQTLPAGVYIAMNGQSFEWDKVRKNRESGIFEAI